MSNRNFEKARRFAKISTRGHEPVRGSDLSGAISRPKDKAVLREEADNLTRGKMITKLIECRCGHKGKVRIPIERASGPFRCVKCKSRIEGRNG